ncbi:MAG: hypothetical protein ACXVJ7_13390 [Acidimicrobiia bacterium]
MCRHLAYVGAARPVGELVFDAPHALIQQGRAPREMVVAKDNPDGWGIAWWSPGEREPHHYRTAATMWTDEAFARAEAPATALLGAVRKASPATALDPVNNAPFVAATRAGAVAFSLNGHAYHESCADRVRAAVPSDALLVGDTDSEALFALVRHRLATGADLGAAVVAAHHAIDPGPEVYVNLLLATRSEIVATTWQHSLYVRTAADGTTVASEPLDDDPGWERVPDAHLLTADATRVALTPLQGCR